MPTEMFLMVLGAALVHATWNALVKTDREAAKHVLYDLVEQLRAVAILLKPFLPRTAENLYRGFNFPQPWAEVRFEDVWVHPRQGEDLRVLAQKRVSRASRHVNPSSLC